MNRAVNSLKYPTRNGKQLARSGEVTKRNGEMLCRSVDDRGTQNVALSFNR